MDKNKIIESAAKLVAKGAYDKAIKEYQRALEVDPKDARVLQKMGELFQKKNDNAQAAVYFTKVAESYSTDGFFLKAVALYKQVLKLNPNLVDVNLKLAELHQQLGLMSEAMAYFQIVANAYDKAGDTKSSLDTLKKMVDLDPENIASRIKLAELYARENMNREATSEFKRAADYLKRNNRADDYIRVAERLSALEPDNLVLAKELASNYLAKGDQKRALAKLQICFKADARDVDTLNLLAQAFQGLGQTSKTISVYKELAKIYGEKGQAAEANQIWAKVQQLDPNDAELQARRTGASPAAPAAAPRPAAAAPSAPPTGQRPAAAAAPSPPPAASRPAAAAAPASGPEQLVKLLTETDVYVKYGLHDKALEHLRKVFAIDPESLDAHEKAYNIYVAAGNQAQAGEQLLNVLRLCTRRRDVSRAQQYLDIILQQNPRHPEVPAFLAALRPAGGPADAEVAEEAILVDSGDEEIIVAEAPEDALAGTTPDDLAINAVATPDEEDVIAEERVILGDDADTTNPFASDVVSDEPFGEPDTLADVSDEPLVDSVDAEIIVEAEAEEEEQPTKEGPLPVELIAQTTRPSPATAAVTVPTYKRPPPAPAPAPAPKPAAPARAPAPPPAAARPAPKAEPPRKPAPPPAAPARAPVAAKAPPPKPKPVDPVAEELDEAGFFLDQGQLDAAREVLETVLVAYPNHPRAKELMGRLDALGQPAEASESAGGRDAFDLAAELASDFTEIGSEDIVDSPSAAGDDFQYSVEEVFSEFKKGLQKVVKPEDVETHYDLGIAYKEMGLMDDAIGEFTVAREGCVGKKKEVDCLTMIGLLQGMKGDHAAAVGSFKEALTSEHAIGETLKATEFELATAQEAMGDAGRALYHFQRVAKLDPGYREVGEIVARLSATTRPVDDPIGPKGGGANGANGAHGGGKPGPGGGKPGGGPSGPAGKPPEKSRKVGYV